MDRVEKMLGRIKSSKLYRCVDWDPEGKAKNQVDKFNSASRSETMTRTGEYLGKLFAHIVRISVSKSSYTKKNAVNTQKISYLNCTKSQLARRLAPVT